jgi:ATP-binding cassette, subfamily C, bacterial
MNDLPSHDQVSTGTRTELSRFATAKSFFFSVLEYADKKALISFIMMVFLGLTEGVGLVMLIPLLHLIGFDGGGTSDKTSLLVNAFFDKTGLPCSLETVLCAYMIIVGTHAIASRYLEVLTARLSFGYTQFMQDLIYNAFARAEWLFSTQMGGANLIRVLTSDLVRAGYATRQLLELIATVLLTLIYLGVILSVSSVLPLFVIASIAVIFLSLRPGNRQAHNLGEVYQREISNLYFATNEHVSGIKVAKSYGLESEHATRFSVITKQVAAKGIRFLQVDAATQMYHRVGAAIALSAFFYIGAKLIALPSSSLIFVVFVFARLSPKVSLIQHYTQYIDNWLPAYRAAILMLDQFEVSGESPPPPLVRPLPFRSAIRLSQVSFSYNGNGGGKALNNIDLVIPARHTIAVVGSSGSGKTTLADLIMGLVAPTDGTIYIDGKPLAGEMFYNWRSSIGYVPQETFLFNDTIRGNLLLVKPGAEEWELWEALQYAAADTFVKAFLDGLDTVVGDRGVRLSGGERQRIALARALLRKPTVLILDEATSSLDRENEQRILDAIEGLHGELTMVIIAHRLSTIRKADSIVVLEQGRIVATGTWESLFQNKDDCFWVRMAQ